MAGASGKLSGEEHITCSGLLSGRRDVLQTLPDIASDLAIKVGISELSSQLKSCGQIALELS